MAEFIKGMRVTTQETKYGEIIKLGIKWDEFQANPVNDKGYLNIDILTSREGKKYAALNTYKSQKPVTAETIAEEFDGEIVQFDGGIDITDEEIPF